MRPLPPVPLVCHDSHAASQRPCRVAFRGTASARATCHDGHAASQRRPCRVASARRRRRSPAPSASPRTASSKRVPPPLPRALVCAEPRLPACVCAWGRGVPHPIGRACAHAQLDARARARGRCSGACMLCQSCVRMGLSGVIGDVMQARPAAPPKQNNEHKHRAASRIWLAAV